MHVPTTMSTIRIDSLASITKVNIEQIPRCGGDTAGARVLREPDSHRTPERILDASMLNYNIRR